MIGIPIYVPRYGVTNKGREGRETGNKEGEGDRNTARMRAAKRKGLHLRVSL